MNPTTIGMIVFTCTFGGAMLGMWLRTTLPKHHLDADSRETVKLGVGLVATMTALVLGLVTASAKSTFDDVDTAVKQTAIEVLFSTAHLLATGQRPLRYVRAYSMRSGSGST